MAYTLKLTNGRLLLNLPDQQSDSVTTSLTLIGKNVNAYGTDINQNYIKILENFSNSVAPTSPLVGQIWYDSGKQQIKVYTINNEFKPVGAPIISATRPAGLAPGDMWYDTTAQQLKFLQAANNLVVIGPQNSVVEGKSGWVNEAYPTAALTTQTAEALYSNGTLIGILSDVAFTITSTLTNMTDVGIGFTANTSDGLPVRFHGTATYATALSKPDGSIVTATDFLSNTGPLIRFDYPVQIVTNTNALTVGTAQDFQFSADNANTTATLFIGNINEDFQLKINSGSFPFKETMLHADGEKAFLGIFNTDPQADVDIAGDVIVRGDLIVMGASTEITTEKLQVVDKELQLAWIPESDRPIDTPLNRETSDTLIDGGGIILRSWRDKEIRFFKATNSWSFSDNVNLLFSTGTYKINGVDVLGETMLYPQVTQAPGLTQIGELTTATIGNIRFISTGDAVTTYMTLSPKLSIFPATPNNVLVIGRHTPDTDTTTTQAGPSVFDYINFGGLTLTNVSSPFTTTDPSAVATKGYVDSVVDIGRNQRAVLTIDVTGKAIGNIPPTHPDVDLFVVQMLDILMDPTETDFPYDTPDGTIVKVMVTRYATPQVTVVSEPIDLGIAVNVIDTDENVRDVINYNQNLVARATFDIQAGSPLTVQRAIKQYQLLSGVWTSIDYPRGSGSGTNLIWPTNGLWDE
jgi:hypothetical protein